MWQRTLLLSLALFAGCKSAPGAVPAAVIMSGVGLAASGISRAQGDCYATCPPGTTCNQETGLCEVLPCRDRCKANEVCRVTGKVEECVLAGDPTLQVEEQMPTRPRAPRPFMPWYTTEPPPEEPPQ